LLCSLLSSLLSSALFFFFFLLIRRPPRSTLFPTRRSSDLQLRARAHTRVLSHSAQRADDLQAELQHPRHPAGRRDAPVPGLCRRSEEHTSELQSRSDLVCRLLLEKKKKKNKK